MRIITFFVALCITCACLGDTIVKRVVVSTGACDPVTQYEPGTACDAVTEACEPAQVWESEACAPIYQAVPVYQIAPTFVVPKTKIVIQRERPELFCDKVKERRAQKTMKVIVVQPVQPVQTYTPCF